MDCAGTVLVIGALLVILLIALMIMGAIFNAVSGGDRRTCPRCGGSGYRPDNAVGINSRHGAQPIRNQRICSFCNGRGKMIFKIVVTRRNCPDCHGTGYLAQTRVRPAGVFRKAQEYTGYARFNYAGDQNYGGSVRVSACMSGKVKRTEEVWEQY